MNGNLPAAPASGVVLATFALRVEQDLVSLRRRLRAAAEDFGLEERQRRAFSAAAYEAASLMYHAGARARVDLRVTESPALQITFHAADSTEAMDEVRRALHGSVGRLRVLVDRLSIDDAASGVVVSLAADIRQARPPLADLAAALPAEGGALHEQNGDLQRSVRELQGELEETNRGVVALFAELDDQAERLRQAEDRFRVLLDSVQDYAICMLDAEGRVESWNAGAERLFGYAAADITGQPFSRFYTAEEREAGLPAAHLAVALEEGRFECEGLRLRHGGSAFHAHVLLTPVRGAERVLRGFSLVVRDITERRRLENDLHRRAEDLAAANRAKEEFLATLSHELRTPLNAMLGWTRLLRMGKLDAAAQGRALETIERNAHVQEQLIADILDVSRIVTGKLRVDLRPVDLAPIIDASLDAVRPAADAKGIVLRCDVQAVGAVQGDPDRLQQVVWNLLSNAIKFTPSNGLVTISVTRNGRHAVIAVTDSGEGIAPDLLPFVFDRFTQGDGSVTRLHGGLGLGLSIVRHIVELHGGRVQARSDGLGRGACFSVDLPLREAHGPAPAPGDPAPSQGA